MHVWIGILVLLIIWISPIVWAWRTNHRERKLITILSLVMPFLGFIISLIIISSRSKAKVQVGDSGVYQCEHCGTSYQLSDYTDESDFYCDNCKKKMSRPDVEQGWISPVHSETVESKDTAVIKRRSFWLWPSIHDEISAKDANKQGMIASIWCAAWLFVITAIQLLSDNGGSRPDLWVLLDISVFILIAWGIYKINRVAPIIGVVYYLLPRVPYWIQHGPKNALFGIIITLAFITSIRGAFAYHKFKKYDDLPFDKESPRIYDKEF